MKFRCPICGSKDLWQPHEKTSFDLILEKRGYSRYDCRNCGKRPIFHVGRQEAEAAPPLQEGAATEAPAITRPVESTIIGASVLISGEISSREGMTVRGVLEGALTMDGFRLVIEAGGEVAAEVSAGSIAVCRDGALTGNVRTPSFVVDDGANFNGQIELTAH